MIYNLNNEIIVLRSGEMVMEGRGRRVNQRVIVVCLYIHSAHEKINYRIYIIIVCRSMYIYLSKEFIQ